jgi:hypothetical protein
MYIYRNHWLDLVCFRGFCKIVGELKITFGLWGQECRMHFKIMNLTIKMKRLNEEVTSKFILENLDDIRRKERHNCTRAL